MAGLWRMAAVLLGAGLGSVSAPGEPPHHRGPAPHQFVWGIICSRFFIADRTVTGAVYTALDVRFCWKSFNLQMLTHLHGHRVRYAFVTCPILQAMK